MNININKGAHAKAAAYQNFGFHLVTKSPWPILMSFSLLNLAIGAVLCMHGFNHGSNVISIGLIITIFGMGLWFRDIVTEGTWRRVTSYISQYFLCMGRGAKEVLVVGQAYHYLTLFLLTITNNNKECLYNLITARALPDQDVKRALSIYKSKSNFYSAYVNNSDNFGYYLAGLQEGDGHISIPALSKNSSLTRVLNPRIVFTSHISNLALYAFIQSELGNIGRFQITGTNTLRYIIGDLKGIKILINLMHGKLRTPKNQTFNNLIKIMNDKCYLSIPESLLDTSYFGPCAEPIKAKAR
jgi:hypothetical protein